MIPRKVTLKELKFENQYYVTGHFNFIFEVKYDDDDDNDEGKKIIRRYNDIRSLYKTLLLKSPGCRIPSIPSKTIWLKINYGNESQVKERQEGVMEFLNHLVEHKILRKNKYVIKFFSPEEKNFSYTNNLISRKGSNDKVDSDDEFASSIVDDPKQKKDEKGDINIYDSDDDDIEPLDDFIMEYNNNKKGIVSKGKKIIGQVYNKVMNYTNNNNNKKNEEGEEENNINENNDESMNSFFCKKLTKEDYDYIKENSKNLGEDFDVNDYDEKINKLNYGVKTIIHNFEKISETRKKGLDALKAIVNKDKNIKNLNKKNKVDDFDLNDEEKNDDNININHNRYIKKIGKYCNIQIGFLDNNMHETINKIKKYQELLQDLLDIYARKKEHINYLGRLHSQKEEFEKQKTNTNESMMNIKINEVELKLEHEIKFIKKLNKDLKYEIDIYKNKKQKDIYIYINELYKEKAKKIKDSIEYLNREKLEDEEEPEKDKNNIDDENIDDKSKDKGIDDFS